MPDSCSERAALAPQHLPDSAGESTHLSGACASSLPGSPSQTPATRWRSEWCTGISASWTTTAAMTSTSGSWSPSSVTWRRKPSPRNAPDVSLTTVTSTRTSPSPFRSWRGAWESARKEVSVFPSPSCENKRLVWSYVKLRSQFSPRWWKSATVCMGKWAGLISCLVNVVHYLLSYVLKSLSQTFVLSTIRIQGKKKLSLAQYPACTIEVLGKRSSDQILSE